MTVSSRAFAGEPLEAIQAEIERRHDERAPLSLASGHFGLGHGSGAHAPDEYIVIEPSNPRVKGWDGMVRSFADYLYELATIA